MRITTKERKRVSERQNNQNVKLHFRLGFAQSYFKSQAKWTGETEKTEREEKVFECKHSEFQINGREPNWEEPFSFWCELKRTLPTRNLLNFIMFVGKSFPFCLRPTPIFARTTAAGCVQQSFIIAVKFATVSIQKCWKVLFRLLCTV